MTACVLPAEPTVADIPHTQLGDFAKQRSFINSLDLDFCNIAYITMALDEFELKRLHSGHIGHRTETWPESIRTRMEKELQRWLSENVGKSVKAFTQGINEGCCVLAIHWKPKS